jgi:TetR/AcrR family transcriptional regulator, transcriptional repressor for nem operon
VIGLSPAMQKRHTETSPFAASANSLSANSRNRTEKYLENSPNILNFETKWSLMRNATLTKANIIEKASVIFNTKGYAGTSIQDIMDGTGLKKGGIYRHFQSKEEIATEAFKHAYQKLKKAYTEALAAAELPDEKLILFLDTLKKFCVNSPVEGGCPILNTATEVDDTNASLRNEVCRAAWDWENIIATVFQKGIDMGIFKPTTNAGGEARIFVMNVEGSLMMGKLHRDLGYIDQVTMLLKDRISSLKL